MKGGRPPVMRGVEAKHLRIRYVNRKGRTRGFYARWRPTLQAWECQLSGYGIQPRRWFSKTQTIALARLRLIPCVWDWRIVVIDQSAQWEGIEDLGFLEGKAHRQLDLLLATEAPQRAGA